MKTNIRPLLGVLLVAFACLFSTGCVSQNAAAKFAEFEKLGITEATITGKFSNTDYVVTVKDGVRRAELNHSNAWLPKVHLVRETPK
jgi:hypothetical protein